MLFLYRGILKERTYMDHKDPKNAELNPLPTLFHHDPLPTYFPFLRTHAHLKLLQYHTACVGEY
jgi:hypothetical protein